MIFIFSVHFKKVIFFKYHKILQFRFLRFEIIISKKNLLTVSSQNALNLLQEAKHVRIFWTIFPRELFPLTTIDIFIIHDTRTQGIRAHNKYIVNTKRILLRNVNIEYKTNNSSVISALARKNKRMGMYKKGIRIYFLYHTGPPVIVTTYRFLYIPLIYHYSSSRQLSVCLRIM